MKDNFLLKKSYQEIFNELSNEEAGELIKGIFQYVNTGNSGLSGLLNVVFLSIKKYIDDNEQKYQKICERNKKNGLNGGRPKKEDDDGNENEKNPVGTFGLENQNKENPVGTFGENTHISYITNHKSNITNHKSNNNLDIIKDIIIYLNNKIKSNFKYTSKSTQTKINARLNEGYNLNDFIVVIDKKYDEWKNTEFAQYLCPDTLFGTKFERYLNQKSSKAIKKNINDKQWDLLKGVYNGTIKINK